MRRGLSPGLEKLCGAGAFSGEDAPKGRAGPEAPILGTPFIGDTVSISWTFSAPITRGSSKVEPEQLMSDVEPGGESGPPPSPAPSRAPRARESAAVPKPLRWRLR